MTSILLELKSCFGHHIDLTENIIEMDDIIVTDEFEIEFYKLLNKVKTFNVHIFEYKLLILFDIILLIYSHFGIVVSPNFTSFITEQCISILFHNKTYLFRNLNSHTQYYLIYLGKTTIEDLRNTITNHNDIVELMKYIIISGNLEFVKLLTINSFIRMKLCLEYALKCNHDEIMNYLLLYYNSSNTFQNQTPYRHKSLIDFLLDIALKYNTNFTCLDLVCSQQSTPSYNIEELVQKLIDNNNFESLYQLSNHYFKWYTPYRLKYFDGHCSNSISEKIKDDHNKVLNILHAHFPIEIVDDILSYVCYY